MESIKFAEKLKSIDPKRLIDPGNDDEVAKFFLALAVFYNDLKSLLFHIRQLDSYYEDTEKDMASPKSGEFGGMKRHLERLMMATVHEFLNFLEENEKIMDTTEFKFILEALNKDLQQRWDILRQIAKRSKKKPKLSFAKALWFIRNKTTFHYDKEILSKGFVDYYHRDKKHFGNETAYYNIGGTMEITRFYFGDGAMQRSTQGQVEKFMKYNLFIKGFKKTIEDLNFSLMYLLKEYIRQRPSI